MLRIVLRLTLSLAWLFIAGCSLVDDDPAPAGPATADASDARTGTIIVNMETVPAGRAGSFTVTGVPTGTISAGGTLVVGDLAPGTYTTTQIDPAPDFDVTGVRCDDTGAGTPSSGDAQTRTAVVNLDAGETVTCTFANSQRGTIVVAGQTEPAGAGGQVQFTGVPSGTMPADGTLVAANLVPGTYTSTEMDPAPQFDLTAVSCDDGGSPTGSSGDPATRSAVFNLDPGEMVTCTFVNTRRATAIVAVDVDGADTGAEFLVTGVPSGTVAAGGTLVAAELSPGTYTATQADPAPDFELASVVCDDEGSDLASSGDPASRSAVFNLDPGETVTCTFLNARGEPTPPGGGGGDGVGQNAQDTGGSNPFATPDPLFEEFPLPEELPAGAGSYLVPRPGPWTAVNFAGGIDCGGMSIGMAERPPEAGEIEVLAGGATVIGTGISGESGVAITMNADPAVAGRYTGTFQATEQGVPITVDYYWQVVTDEFVVGFLASSFSSQGVSCSLYRPFELRYDG